MKAIGLNIDCMIVLFTYERAKRWMRCSAVVTSVNTFQYRGNRTEMWVMSCHTSVYRS